MKSLGLIALLTAGFFGAFTPCADAAPTTEDEVQFLIRHVAESKLIFIRNGSEHDAAEAAKLMQRKYDYVKKAVQTPEDFIRLAGSESHLSGKPYLVKMPDGKIVESAYWLNRALRDHRKTHP